MIIVLLSLNVDFIIPFGVWKIIVWNISGFFQSNLGQNDTRFSLEVQEEEIMVMATPIWADRRSSK